MDRDIRTYNHPSFGELRCMCIDGVVWFVGSDVARRLLYKNPHKAIRDHVTDDDKLTERIVQSGQGRDVILINESGLYSLVFSSKQEMAMEFKHWVTSVVLPQIRQTGGYLPMNSPPDGETGIAQPLSDLEIMANALMIAKRTLELKDKQLEAQKDKVDFANAVEASEGSIYIAQLANLLHQNGYETGQNRLFQTLRDMGYLYKTVYDTRPMQKYIEKGLFQVKDNLHTDRYGNVHLNVTTMVTPVGQKYFIDLFCRKKPTVLMLNF